MYIELYVISSSIMLIYEKLDTVIPKAKFQERTGANTLLDTIYQVSNG